MGRLAVPFQVIVHLNGAYGAELFVTCFTIVAFTAGVDDGSDGDEAAS